MLELKLQYFGHLMQRIDSLEKTLMLGKIDGRRIRRVGERESVVYTDRMGPAKKTHLFSLRKRMVSW